MTCTETTADLFELGLPRVGAGIGGLEWADVREVLREVAAASPAELLVVELPSH